MMRLRRFFFPIVTTNALLWSSLASAQCFTVSDIHGKGAYANEQYKLVDDGFSTSEFDLTFSEGSPSVVRRGGTPNDLNPCMLAGQWMLLCVFGTDSDAQSTVETWSVDAGRGTVYYTKSKSGFGVFDGAQLFVGRIAGRCDAQ